MNSGIADARPAQLGASQTISTHSPQPAQQRRVVVVGAHGQCFDEDVVAAKDRIGQRARDVKHGLQVKAGIRSREQNSDGLLAGGHSIWSSGHASENAHSVGE